MGLLIIGQSAPIVTALSPNQRKLFQSGINYFDASTCNAPGAGGTPSVSGETTGPKEAVQKVVWDTLTGGGIDPMHTAAVMGNISSEGVWDPTNIEDPAGQTKSRDVIQNLTGQTQGYGLIGWTPGNSLLDQMQEVGVESEQPYTAETQAAVILGDIQGKTNAYDSSVGKQFLNTTTIEEATKFYEGGDGYGFERPGDPGATQADRIAAATQFLHQFGGEAGSPAATPSVDSCCPAGGTPTSLEPGTLPNYIKEPYNSAFTAAGKKFNVDPAYLVGIFYDENFGYQNAVSAFNSHEQREPPPPYGSGDPWPVSSADAEGPFQFIPGTWDEYGYDGNGDGKKDPNDVIDAAFAAAHLLAANGGDGTLTLNKVIRSANAYSGGYPEYPQAAWSIVQTIHADAGGSPASVGGAAGSPISDPVAGDACSGDSVNAQKGTVDAAVQAAKLLSNYKIGYILGGLHGPGQLDITDSSKLQQIGTDCSGSVSWVLHQAGMFPGNAGIVSGDFGSWGQAGEGQEMTVWENASHVFIEFNVSGLGHYELNTAYGVANGIESDRPGTWPTNTPGATGPGPQFFKWGSSGWDTTSGFTPRHLQGT